MPFNDPLLPYSGIHATTEDLQRNRQVARRMMYGACEHELCHRDAKMSFKLENGDLIDVCMEHFFYLGNCLRDEET